MKTYIESITVVLNGNYDEAKGFNSMELALESYNEIKNRFFGSDAKEFIYDSGEYEITDGEDTLRIEFATKSCSDFEFEMLHPESFISLV
ncbi:MAG: hypothetical protein ACYC2P_08825 [Paludibacteraceae bacterium]